MQLIYFWVVLCLAVYNVRAEDGHSFTFDSYGGCEAIKGDKTGFFHLEKKRNRWMMYSPSGNGIVPLGISGMHAQQASWNGAMQDGKSHRDSCLKKFKTIDNWKKETASRIRDWGFNYTGCFTYTDLKSEEIPYILTLSVTKYAIDHRAPVCGNIWYELGNNYHCPDLWHPDLLPFMVKRFQEEAKDSINDPLLMYYYPDELDQLQGFAGYADHMGWAALVGEETVGSDPDKRTATRNKNETIFKNYTKERFIRYVKDLYTNDIDALNASWGTAFKGFDDFLTIRRDDERWGRGKNPERKGFPQYRKDLDGFIVIIASRYVDLVNATVKPFDTNHLIGFQLYGDKPNEFLMAGFENKGGFDFYMVDWGGDVYDRYKKPFTRLLYPSACNDSPLRFQGTCKKWQLCLDEKGEKPAPTDYESLKNTRMFLKIWDSSADYWFRLKFAGGRLPLAFNNVPVPRDTIVNPWKSQVLFTGQDDNGRSWFTVRSWDPYTCGRAWELFEGLENQNNAGVSVEYIRSTAIPHTNFSTQKERGEWWQSEIERVAEEASPEGDYYLLGAEWWKYMDNGWTYWVEQVNWGLVSLRDNAYDGQEATRLGADGIANTWDDETADYGDCISLVKSANLRIYQHIISSDLNLQKTPAKAPK